VKLGLFGGTFDPPHTGHLIVAQDAALALRLDRVLFVPAAVPPHKQHGNVSPASARRRMLELADDPVFALEPLELERGGPSYTVDTLRQLHRRAAADYTLLLGADQYAEFDSWRDPSEIRTLARIAVLDRAGAGAHHGSGLEQAPASGRRGVVHVGVTRIDISSTEIRARIASGQPIRYLVPAAVEKFIYETGLYVRNGTPRVG
jgi:nicotinate-nucleotide adenylyltransferase